MIATLPDRLYGEEVDDRRSILPYGRKHPAKMSLALLRDLLDRYTLPGQTWLDPFFGVGSTGTAILHGRSVIGVELEAPHAESARRNMDRLAPYAKGGATAIVMQGDSRKLRDLLEARGLVSTAGVLASPPYADSIAQSDAANDSDRRRERMRAAGIDTSVASNVGGSNAQGRTPQRYDLGGALASPPYADSVNSGAHGIDWTKAGPATGNRRRGAGTVNEETLRAQLNYSGVAGALGSPPYADVAKRNRSEEPYAQKDPARSAKYGQDSPNRNIDGYGKSEAQIGALPIGTLTSPPYANTVSDWDATAKPLQGPGTDQHYTDERHTARQNIGNIPYLNGTLDTKRSPKAPEGRETYLDAIRTVYGAVYDVTPPGGVLVLVTGNYVRDREVVDLAAYTIDVCAGIGWTPLERWRAKKAKVSLWRRLHHRRELREAKAEGRAPKDLLIDYEDVLVFCKGAAPAWPFAELPPRPALRAKLQHPATAMFPMLILTETAPNGGAASTSDAPARPRQERIGLPL